MDAIQSIGTKAQISALLGDRSFLGTGFFSLSVTQDDRDVTKQESLLARSAAGTYMAQLVPDPILGRALTKTLAERYTEMWHSSKTAEQGNVRNRRLCLTK